MIKRLLMAMALLTGLGSTAGAQQAGPVGQWYCEWGFQNTAPGQAANAVGGNFQMTVDPNGVAQGQGVQMASAGQFQFQFQGQVQVNGAEFLVSGIQQGGLGFEPQRQFTSVSRFVSPNNMALTQRYQNGQVLASQCQRTG